MVAGSIGMFIYTMLRMFAIYVARDYHYNSKEFTYPVDEMNNLGVTLGKFNNSLNFIFGITGLPKDEDGTSLFDIQNNPYVDFISYELTPGLTAHLLEEKYEFGRCTTDHLDVFMKEHS